MVMFLKVSRSRPVFQLHSRAHHQYTYHLVCLPRLAPYPSTMLHCSDMANGSILLEVRRSRKTAIVSSPRGRRPRLQRYSPFCPYGMNKKHVNHVTFPERVCYGLAPPPRLFGSHR